MSKEKSNYQRTADWLAACGKEPGNKQHLATQVGVHLEECMELLDELIITGSAADNENLVTAATTIKGVAYRLKQGATGVNIKNRASALDALCDAEVTGNGVAFLAGFRKDEADFRVLRSNESKLNEDGTPVILAGGKIGKSARYVPPFLLDLV